MGGFHRTLDELWEKAAPESVLDVGCGEGVLTHEWAERLGDKRIVGIKVLPTWSGIAARTAVEYVVRGDIDQRSRAWGQGKERKQVRTDTIGLAIIPVAGDLV